MKCDRCGKNEATFYYKSNINGRVTETHLCPDCARAMGYAGSMAGRMSSWFNDDWFDRPFRMLEPFFGGFGSTFVFKRWYRFPFPTLVPQAQSAAPESPAKDDLLPHDEAMSLALERKRNALQAQLHNAVEEERYEDAARLRDELKSLNGKAS